MMKNEAIQRINEELQSSVLNDKNTRWVSIVPYGNDAGWWLNIPFSAFRQDLHVILNNDKAREFQYLRIKGNQILSPATKFRSNAGAADIFMSASKPKKLVDLLSGGTKFNLSKYVIREFSF